MQNEDHRRAWRLLQEVPEGQKSAFIVRAILQMDQEDRLETMLRRVLREEQINFTGEGDAQKEQEPENFTPGREQTDAAPAENIPS